MSEEILVRYEGETVILEHCSSKYVCESSEQLSELGFQWSKRNWNARELEKITTGGRFEVSHNGSLTIVDARLSDSGLYQVSMTDGQGSTLHIVQSLIIVDLASSRIRRWPQIHAGVHDLSLAGEYI